MTDADVVIVGEDGTEHVFPPGFDPKRAARIVSGPLTPREDATAKWAGVKEAVGQTWPVAAGLAGAVTVPAGAVMTAARFAARPAVAGTAGALVSGIKGYQRGGILQGVESAMRGGLEGAGLAGLGRLGGVTGLLRTLTAATPEAAPALRLGGQAVALSQLGPAAQRLVLSPETAAQVQQLEAMLAAQASRTGMASAAGPAGASTRAALLKLLAGGPE